MGSLHKAIIVCSYGGVTFFLRALKMGISPLLPQLKNYFQTSYTLISIVPTAFFLSSILLSMPLSRIADKIGLKKYTYITLGLFILSQLLCGIANNLFTIVTLLFIAGLALSASFPVGRAVVERVYSSDASGRAMSLLGLPGLLGAILGSILFGHVAEKIGWNNSFYVFALLIASFVLLFGIINRGVEYKLEEEEKVSILSIVKNRGLLLLSFAQFGVMSSSQGAYFFSVPMIMDDLGMSAGVIGYVAMAGMVGAVIGMPVGGIVSDKVGKKNAVILGTIGLPILIFLLPYQHEIWQFIIITIFLSFCVSFSYSATGGALSLVVSPHEQATASGLFTTISNIGIPIIMLLSGWMASEYSLRASCYASLIAAIIGVVSSMAFKKIVIVQPQRHKGKETFSNSL